MDNEKKDHKAVNNINKGIILALSPTHTKASIIINAQIISILITVERGSGVSTIMAAINVIITTILVPSANPRMEESNAARITTRMVFTADFHWIFFCSLDKSFNLCIKLIVSTNRLL